MHSRIFALSLVEYEKELNHTKLDKEIEPISEFDLPIEYMYNTMCDYFLTVEKKDWLEDIQWLTRCYGIFEFTRVDDIFYLKVKVKDLIQFNLNEYLELENFVKSHYPSYDKNDTYRDRMDYIVSEIDDILHAKSGFYIIDRDNNGYTPYTLVDMIREWSCWYPVYDTLTFRVDAVFDYHN